VDLTDLKVMGFKPDEIERYSVTTGDLVICEGGEAGRCSVYRGTAPVMYQKAIHRLRPFPGVVMPEFLQAAFEYGIRSSRWFPRFSETIIQHLPLEKIKAVEIPIPPPMEQRRIVEALDERLSELDASVVSLDRAERNLVRYRAAVLSAACSGNLVPTEAELAGREGRGYEPAALLLTRIRTERRNARAKTVYEELAQPDSSSLPRLPEGWAWTTLDHIAAEVRNGLGTPPRADEGEPILRISAVRPGKVDAGDVRFLGKTPDNAHMYRLKPGDLLFTRYNGTKELVGACGFVPESGRDLLYPDKLIRVRMVPGGALPGYVMLAAGSGKGSEHVRAHLRTTAGQVGISGQDIKGIPIPMPPLA
jgi:type I restriction enzyme S subunit